MTSIVCILQTCRHLSASSQLCAFVKLRHTENFETFVKEHHSPKTPSSDMVIELATSIY